MTYPEYIRGLGMSEGTTKELITPEEMKRPAAADAFGDLEQALRALRIYESHISAGRAQGRHIADVTKKVPSRGLLRKTKALSPESIDEVLATVNRHIGRNFAAEGHPKKGVPYARNAVQLQPDNFDNYAVLGSLQMMTGKLPEAVANLKRAFDMKPDSRAANTLLAQAYAEMFKKDPRPLATEVTYLEGLRKYSPKDQVISSWLGIAYVETNQHDKAVALLRNLGRLNKTNAAPYLVLAGALLETHPRAAIPLLEQLAEFLPTANVQVYLGAAMQRSGHNRVAAKHYESALEILFRIEPAKRAPEDWAMIDTATHKLVTLDKNKYQVLRHHFLSSARQFGYNPKGK